ncbi:replication initiator [Streptomyces sp. NPDC047725]|uniref:replication initiator n=1 Tax=Streptomyces sp. NPDC047725 TaxID=3365487 RepID=UPI00371E9FF6
MRSGLRRKAARLSFAKLAEYQQRGLVHFHAVIRLDGPAGPCDPPPAWDTSELLADAVRLAATRAHIEGPKINGRARSFAFAFGVIAGEGCSASWWPGSDSSRTHSASSHPHGP